MSSGVILKAAEGRGIIGNSGDARDGDHQAHALEVQFDLSKIRNAN